MGYEINSKTRLEKFTGNLPDFLDDLKIKLFTKSVRSKDNRIKSFYKRILDNLGLSNDAICTELLREDETDLFKESLKELCDEHNSDFTMKCRGEDGSTWYYYYKDGVETSEEESW